MLGAGRKGRSALAPNGCARYCVCHSRRRFNHTPTESRSPVIQAMAASLCSHAFAVPTEQVIHQSLGILLGYLAGGRHGET